MRAKTTQATACALDLKKQQKKKAACDLRSQDIILLAAAAECFALPLAISDSR
jgi:hypothetical protein